MKYLRKSKIAQWQFVLKLLFMWPIGYLKRIVLTLFQLSLTILTLSNCASYVGHRGVSDSIEDSKEANMFIMEYVAPQLTDTMNEGTVLNVERAWLEWQWLYDSRKVKRKLKEYQLIVELKGNTKLPPPSSFTIGTTYDWNFRQGNNYSLIADLDSIPSQDTLSWPIQNGPYLDSISEKKIIGTFVLVRKD